MLPNDQPTETDIEERCREELISLNHSIIDQVTDVVSNSKPASDLWPQFRILILNYKRRRSDILEPQNPPQNPKPEPVNPEPEAEREDKFKHRIPEEDVCIVWPLSPQLQNSLQIPATAKEVIIQGGQASILRLTLNDLLIQGKVLYHYTPRAVVCIFPDTVVKINKSQDPTEVHMLHYIHEHSRQIPVPRPLGMVTIGKWSYTFTSFIPGIPLDRIWGNLSLDKKHHVREQLNRYFTELRRLPVPSKEGYLGGGMSPICKGGHRFRKVSSMPIANNAQFNNFLLDDSWLERARLDYLRGSLPSNYQIVMTHGDLCPLNILVESEDTLNITGIVDWETGGAYPEYWEYINAFRSSFIGKDDWCLYLPESSIGKFFDEYARYCVIERFARG
ncbi:kinase-like protein [Amniculicola lignicola CBS 123094]|uniref:Kinase-like protein n=1 Tax=Amniculicola lignicola CBS 123094 TaxID=1392246 RepID=A0A6A5VY87_9PLEO|nr:kinase-like protein [Amniculicola lignicola CBS 123094]